MKNDILHEGLTADQYTDPHTRALILADYRLRYSAKITPVTNPELFDPLAPPNGWSYDPYYEIWIKQ